MIIPQSVRERSVREAHLTSLLLTAACLCRRRPPHITMEESQVIKAVRPDWGGQRAAASAQHERLSEAKEHKLLRTLPHRADSTQTES